MKNRIKTQALKNILLTSIIVKNEDEIKSSYPGYLTDESRYEEGKAEKLFFPKSEEEVVAIVRSMNEKGIPITISSARTGITGGALPLGGVILSLEKMNKILAVGYDEELREWYVRAEAGISLEELSNKVRKKQFEELKNSAEVEQKALEQFLSEKTFFFPPDPTEMSALLGGAVATNASGARTFKYGPIRKWVRRIHVVLSNGDLLDIKREQVTAEEDIFVIEMSDGTVRNVKIPDYKMPAIKNAAGLYAKSGMDLIDLFIGSEGILGVITEVEVRLAVREGISLTVMAFTPTEEDAIGLVHDLRSTSSIEKPELIEYFDSKSVNLLRRMQSTLSKSEIPDLPHGEAIVFFEMTCKEEEMDKIYETLGTLLSKHHISEDATWAGMDTATLEKMKIIRHTVPESINNIIAQRKQQYPKVHKLGTDMAVPDEHLEAIIRFYKEQLDAANLEYAIFGHIGDNHLHVNIIPANDDEVEQGKRVYLTFARKAIQLGGTVSAEHGIGKMKHQYLREMYGDKGINQIADVKQTLDPKNIFNPGNMIPSIR